MLKHREVPALQTLCLGGVGSLVVALAPQILSKIEEFSDPQDGVVSLYKSLDIVQQLLFSHVPYCLYDSMATHVLHAVKDLIEKTKKTYDPFGSMSAFVTEMNVVVSLTGVVLNQNLKQIDFSAWPKIMRYVLYKNLGKLTGLEILYLGSCTGGWRTSENDRGIVEGIAGMKNLRSLCLCFDCSDCIIQVLGDNCPHLESIDITSSRSVTDRSIASLLKCTKLREVQLHRTSISVIGLAQLIAGLPKLQDVGRCYEFGLVLDYLSKSYPSYGPFGLKKLITRDLNTESLRLLVELCPNIESVSLFLDEQIPKLSALAALDNLKELKLLSCCFYADCLKQLLKIRGCNLTSLHLEHVEEIDMNALIYVSQYCPRLKNLVLYNCDFIDQTPTYSRSLRVKPFQCLERLFWVVDCAIVHLELILLNSFNIKFIHLGSSTGITHATITKILAVNPLKSLEELRILYSSDMNINSVKMLVNSCSNLRVLSELESWQGISLDELQKFKEYIQANNFDLDIRPTLSY